jgi:two-component sensor histidine kinase/HAMP domain-containing protein
MKKLLSSLRFRLLLLVLLAMVPALALTYYTGVELRRHEAAQVQDEARRFIQFVAAHQERHLEKGKQLLLTLDKFYSTSAPKAGSCNQFLKALQEQNPIFATIAILDPNGEIICCSQIRQHIVNAADRPWFKQAVAGRTFALGNYEIGPVSGKPVVVLAYPRFEPDEKLRNVFLVSLNLDWINHLLNQIKLPPMAELTILDRHGTVLARHPDPGKLVGKTIANDPLVQDILMQKEGITEAPVLVDIKGLYAFTPITQSPEIGAVVMLGTPSKVAFAGVDRIMALNLSGLLTVGLLALLAAWYGGHVFIWRKVKSLTAMARQLARGDLSARSQLPNTGELGQLASAFDRMAQTIEAREIERRQAEEALRVSEAQHHNRAEELEALMDAVPAAVLIAHDPECQRITGNCAAYELLRSSYGANLSQTAPDAGRLTHFKILHNGMVIPPQEIPLHVAAARGIVGKNYEFDTLFDDGTIRHGLGNVNPLWDEQGKTRGAIGAFIDVTERKEAEEKIKASLEEKEILLREIHHRTRNNMQVICSLLSLQTAHIQDERLLPIFHETKNRIRAMTLVHEKIYMSPSLVTLDLADYIKDLVGYLLEDYQVDGRKIAMHLNLESFSASLETAIPLGLILNEFITNALQHAFPGEQVGEIGISLHKCADGELELTIVDNGIGLPPEIDFKNAGSLGFKLVNALANNQLQGKLLLHLNQGTKFHLKFPEPYYPPRI